MKNKTFYIKTLGCKVNQYESQVIRENFLKNGYIEAGDANKAEVYIVNTCTVTSNSDTKSLRLIRNAIKKKYNCVIATGCMMEDESLDISKLKGVDFIIKNREKYNIPLIIDRVTLKQSVNMPISISGFKSHTRVFVKVQDGCSNACSYCKVRVVRGRSRSRAFKEILNECKTLIKNGSKEIVLAGICLGAYGKDLSKDLNLCELVRQICKIDGNWRLRLSSIEPKDVNEELISELKSQEKLCKHLHMPFQSGDNFILKQMNRPYTKNDYLNIVYRLKNIIPDIAISTDIMVGFPQETEERFENTVDFIKIVRPMRMHVFPYSKRKGTKAYDYRDEVSNSIKKERERKLLSLARELSIEFVDRFVGKVVEVLIEDKRSKEGYLQGYTDRYIKVYIEGLDNRKSALQKVTCLS